MSSGGFYDERLYSTSIVCLLNSIRRGIQGQGPWSMESPENHPKGSLVVSFLFLLEPKGDPAQRSAFGKEEGGCEYGAFAAPAEAEWSRVLLTLRRFFSFSEKRKKRMGAQKHGRSMVAPKYMKHTRTPPSRAVFVDFIPDRWLRRCAYAPNACGTGR